MTLKLVLIFVLISNIYCAPTEAPAVNVQQSPQRTSLFGCGSTQYACKTIIESPVLKPRCIDITKLCNGVEDCPAGEDEKNDFCFPKEVRDALIEAAQKGIQNDFAGTGFMFSVGNLIVSGGSNVKMFNQNSDNGPLPTSNAKVNQP